MFQAIRDFYPTNKKINDVISSILNIFNPEVAQYANTGGNFYQKNNVNRNFIETDTETAFSQTNNFSGKAQSINLIVYI